MREHAHTPRDDSAGALPLRSGAAVDVLDPSNCTPLHIALRAKTRDGVAAAILLLNAGAQPVDDPVGQHM